MPQPLILEGTLYYECPALSAAPDPAGAPGPAPGVKPNMNLQTHKNQPNHKAHQQHIGNSLKHVLLHTTPPVLDLAGRFVAHFLIDDLKRLIEEDLELVQVPVVHSPLLNTNTNRS